MEHTKYSRNRLLGNLDHWNIARDHVDPIYNYLVYGFEPGGFFTSVFANDFMGAIGRSHPCNSVESLKSVTQWIQTDCPVQAWGSYAKVRDWIKLTAIQRRSILEDYRLMFTEQEEIMMALAGKTTHEPMFF